MKRSWLPRIVVGTVGAILGAVVVVVARKPRRLIPTPTPTTLPTQTLTPRMAALLLESTPPGAAVAIDGVPVGTTPALKAVEIGVIHDYTFSLAGYVIARHRFFVAADGVFHVDLKPVPFDWGWGWDEE